MMLLVCVITSFGLYFAQRNLAASVRHSLEREFQTGLDALQNIHELRHAALAEVCRTLVSKPRIHAALEDEALDLLYPMAKDELREVMNPAGVRTNSRALQGLFYRFLDQKGRVISKSDETAAGSLKPQIEAQLGLPRLPHEPQLGYVAIQASGPEEIAEVIAMTIVSTDTGEAIAALAIGFQPAEPGAPQGAVGIKSGLWLDGRLHFPSLGDSARNALGAEVAGAIANGAPTRTGLPLQIEGIPHLLFYQRLNPDSLYPPAYQVAIFSLADLQSRQAQLRRRIVGAGVIMLVSGLAASQFFSKRLAVPVERLAVDSEENRTQRARAEAALELTNEGLQRAIRFSADASHQLKTPVTVLRAGLEELLAREHLTPELRNELAELVHQTYRLTSVIEDLLLLSRADAGRLQINFTAVDLTQLLEGALDDLGAFPEAGELAVETDFPKTLWISGEKRYVAIIVQNLLENARKYNQPGGRIRVAASAEGDRVMLTVANTGQAIPIAVQAHIFERFHRGSAGENVPGHGLGLNLARELARLHDGDLRLVKSSDGWTEFQASFRLAIGRPMEARSLI